MAHHQLNKVVSGLKTAGQVAGALHTAYQVGKGLYSLGAAAAPYAALLL